MSSTEPRGSHVGSGAPAHAARKPFRGPCRFRSLVPRHAGAPLGPPLSQEGTSACPPRPAGSSQLKPPQARVAGRQGVTQVGGTGAGSPGRRQTRWAAREGKAASRVHTMTHVFLSLFLFHHLIRTCLPRFVLEFELPVFFTHCSLSPLLSLSYTRLELLELVPPFIARLLPLSKLRAIHIFYTACLLS